MRRMTFVILATCIAAVMSAEAGERVHTVSSGESASSIARHYYGNAKLGDLLLRYNGKNGTVIRAGESLRIPYCEIHRVEKGDSWSGLGMAYLGRAHAYPALAALNGLTAEDVLRVGQPIVIPVVLSHRIERGDTIAALTERFYGDPELADLLQVYNEIEDPRRLSPGETVKVPLVSIRLRENLEETRPRKETGQSRQVVATPRAQPETVHAREEAPVPDLPLPESPTLEPPALKMPARQPSVFEEEIRDVRKVFADGDYARARRILEALREKTLTMGSNDDRVDVLRLLAFVYVAFDMRSEACVAYRSMSGFTSETNLDPDLVSPKIRETLSRCGA